MFDGKPLVLLLANPEGPPNPGRESGLQQPNGYAATGFTTGLEPVVGHLDVLDRRGVPLVHGADDLPSARGLHFVGIKAELSGLLRVIGREARAVGRALATAD